MPRFKSDNPLTDNQKELILKKFFRTKLRKGEKIIDNSDPTIAKEVSKETGSLVNKNQVCHLIRNHLDDKWSKLFNRGKYSFEKEVKEPKKKELSAKEQKSIKQKQLFKEVDSIILNGGGIWEIAALMDCHKETAYRKIKKITGLKYLQYKAKVLNENK